MKHLILIIKSSIAMFAMSMFLTTPSVHAEDIEIYGIADADNPPVNVLFVFDLSGSMNLNIDGTAFASNTGEDSRYEILQEALTNVLAQNKDLGNLRVGLSWFSKYSSGIRWPITGIKDDINGRDATIPAGTYETWEYLPEAFRSFGNINNSWKTKMVPSLLEAAYYFRGDEVWRGRRREPQYWHTGQKRFRSGNKYSSHFSSYTPSAAALASPYPEYRGTKAYAKYQELRTTNSRTCNSRPVDAAHPLPNWCQNGFNSPTSVENPATVSPTNRMNVRQCNTRTRSYTTSGGYCRVDEEDYVCTPRSPDPETGLPRPDNCVCPPGEWVSSSTQNYTQHYCKHDYIRNKGEWFGATYNTPIGATCTPSYIVLLSDGAPTVTHTAGSDGSFMGAPGGTDVRIKYMTGETSCADIPDVPFGKCGPELVEYLASEDQVDAFEGSKVLTYTIGFNVDGAGRDYLELLAEKGKGVFYPASSASDLEDAFDLIIDSITGENESFTGLVTTIRASTLSSDERVFMNMFKPGDTQSWHGNTKGFFISQDGLLDVNGNQAVIEVDGAERFVDSSTSFWSSSADGNFVELGGASAKLNAGSRDIFTYVDPADPSDSSLTKITTSETLITPALLGVADDTEKDAVISWLYDSKMSDPLHAKPVLIPYTSQDVLYSMTNQGLVHAIDTTNPTTVGDYGGGDELFAFIPQALLPRLKDHKANLNAAGHVYGLDGPMSYYHADTNRDQIVNNGEKVYLYFGMRRGGNNYYALDVSDPSSPKLAWRIEGGSGDFAELSQTWSRMIPTTVKWSGGVDKKVLIFGGGYDVDQDDHSNRTQDDMGNAIFIVDAVNGTFLWKGTKGSGIDGGNKMKYSIPGDIAVIDSDDDRIADRLYFGDMGGQVWRVDLDQANNGASISGYRLANLASGAPADNRRFYSAPSVAQVRGDSGLYYAVAIGSGFRAHPLASAVNNYFYMIKDTNAAVGAPATSWSTVNHNGSDLYDITANVIGEGNGGSAEDIAAAKAAAKITLDGKKGWKLKLEDTGEKNLSPSLVFDFKLAFTTFTPASGGNEICGGSGGVGRFYLVNLENGTPVMDFYDDNTPDSNLAADNRYKTVPGLGIPSEPVPYFPPGVGKVQLYVGKHGAADIDNPMVRINWKILQ